MTPSSPRTKGPVGVYICHCGQNIAATVDVPGLAETLSADPSLSVVRHYPYLCSKPGQELIRDDILAGRAGRVVVAACSPRMHETTFRKVLSSCEVNPYLLKHVNIREHCSWVHPDREAATGKALSLIKAGIGRARLHEPLLEGRSATVRRALVIGGGPAGLAAAWELVSLGIETVLVEKTGKLGGKGADFPLSFPDRSPVAPFIAKMVSELENSPLAEILTSAEVTALKGSPGSYTATVEGNSGKRDLEAGAVIVATGFSVYRPEGPKDPRPELGYGTDGRILTQTELDSTLAMGGGPPLVEGKPLESAVFVQCVGSRDKTAGASHCSRTCCMVSVRQAGELMLRGVKDVTVLYTDMRTYARGAEEEYETAGRNGTVFRRGGVSEIFRSGEKRAVRFEDTLEGKARILEADLVVLACGQRPGPDTEKIGRLLGVGRGPDGFFLEAHPKLRPQETAVDCVYLAGACQGPKTLPEAVQSARAAAVKAAQPLIRGSMAVNPVISEIDPERCASCGLCRAACPADAIHARAPGLPMRVKAAICKGCGACAAACPSGAASLKHYSDVQIFAELCEKSAPSARAPLKTVTSKSEFKETRSETQDTTSS